MAQASCIKNSVKFGCAVFKLSEWTDTQTNRLRHTVWYSPQYFATLPGRSNNKWHAVLTRQDKHGSFRHLPEKACRHLHLFISVKNKLSVHNRSNCKIRTRGTLSLPFPFSLLPLSFFLTSPSPPLPSPCPLLEVSHLNPAMGLGERCKLPVGFGIEP